MEKSSSTIKSKVYQTCKDHTVTGETFQLLWDEEKEMLVTFPKPEKSELPGYYQSEDYISHTDSSKSYTDKIYQLVKKFMLKKKIGWIEKEFPDKGRLLDIGAGTGDFLMEAKIKGWKINGVEPNEKARNQAKAKNIKLAPDTSNFKSEKFDVITMWHVLEHVYDLKSQIIELEHLLKKDGLLIIAVPNFKSFDAQHYKKYWAAYDVPRHLWHFSRGSFKHLLLGTGFEKVKTKPLLFDSIYVSLLSEKNKTGKPDFLKALYIGIKSNLKAINTSEYSSIAYFFRKNS